MEHEEWTLGTATAWVWSSADALTVVVRGVITAPAYEAAFRRMSAAGRGRRTLILGAGLYCATGRSLAEAAARGTPAAQAGRPLVIVAHRRRWAWLVNHCAHLVDCGLPGAKPAQRSEAAAGGRT